MYPDTIERVRKYFELDKTLDLFRRKEIIRKAVEHGRSPPPWTLSLIPEDYIYPDWKVTISMEFYFKATGNLTRYVKEDGRLAFITTWKHNQLEKRRIKQDRIVEYTEMGSSDHDVESSITLLSEHQSIIDIDSEDMDQDLPLEEPLVDVNRIAGAMIGCKGTVIRWFQRQFQVNISIKQNEIGTAISIKGEDADNVYRLIKTMEQYNEEPKLLYKLIEAQRRKHVRIFVDVSNIVGGIPMDNMRANSSDYTAHIDIRMLMEAAKGLRTVERIVAVGSSPARDNIFWQNFGNTAEIIVQQRINRDDGTSFELCVDAQLHKMIRHDISTFSPDGRVLVLLSGDGNLNHGYDTTFPMVITEALLHGWYIELMCWQRTMNRIYKQIEMEWPTKFKIILLDEFKNDITFFKKLEPVIHTRRTILNKRHRANKRHKEESKRKQQVEELEDIDNHKDEQTHSRMVHHPVSQRQDRSQQDVEVLNKPGTIEIVSEYKASDLCNTKRENNSTDSTIIRSRNRLKQFKYRKRKHKSRQQADTHVPMEQSINGIEILDM